MPADSPRQDRVIDQGRLRWGWVSGCVSRRVTTSKFPLDHPGSLRFAEIREKIGYQVKGRLILITENARGSARVEGEQLQYLFRGKSDQYYQLLEATEVHNFMDKALV